MIEASEFPAVAKRESKYGFDRLKVDHPARIDCHKHGGIERVRNALYRYADRHGMTVETKSSEGILFIKRTA